MNQKQFICPTHKIPIFPLNPEECLFCPECANDSGDRDDGYIDECSLEPCTFTASDGVVYEYPGSYLEERTIHSAWEPSMTKESNG